MVGIDDIFNSMTLAIIDGIDGTTMFFGNTLIQYTIFIGIVLLFFVVSKLIYMLVSTNIRAMTSRTRTDIDDILIDIIEGPLTFFVIIIGVYFGMTFALTQGTQPQLFIADIFKILMIINIAWLLLKFIDSVVVRYLRMHAEKTDSKLDDQLIPIVRKSLQIGVVCVTIIFILGNMGFDVTTLIAGLGIGGLAIALAAQDTLSNFIGSVVILTSKPFQIRDMIRVGQNTGTVKEITLRNTKLETPTGTILIIPNNKIVTDVIENFGMAKTRTIMQTIGLAYNTDSKKLDRAIAILQKIVSSHPNVVKHDIKFIEFGAYSLNISVQYLINDTAKLRETPHEINMEIKKAFEKEKIEMALQTQPIQVAR